MNPLWPYNSQGVHAGGGRGRRGVGEGEERIRIYARAEISLLSVRLFMEKVCSHDRNCWMREECGSRFCIHNHSSPAPYSAVHPSHRSGLHKCKTRQSRFLSVSFASLIRHCARSSCGRERRGRHFCHGRLTAPRTVACICPRCNVWEDMDAYVPTVVHRFT